MFQVIKNLLNVSGSQSRSKIVAKNASFSLLMKGGSILISFVFVPLYLHSVGARQYGIILTITSISNFISFFDVGIGNGLRSKLGKAMATGDIILGRKYVSTSYFYITILFVCVCAVYLLISPWISWYKILNIPATEVNGLNTLVSIIFGLFCARFIFQLVSNVLMADQKSSLSDMMGFSVSLLNIIICLILKGLHLLNFYSLLVTMCTLPVLVPATFSVVLFLTKYKALSPSLSFVDRALSKDLLGLGFKFFLIQIAGVVIFTTTNILIAQLFDIGEVTRYNIAYKYYNITVILFTLLMSPLWGAFSNAYHQGDMKWIVKNIKLYLLLILCFVVVNLAQFFIYPYFIHFWLKREFIIPAVLVISFIVYNIILCYNDIFAHFLASVGEVNQQVYAAVAGGIINIPITIFLAKHTQFGLSSILIANILCLLPSTFVTTFQTVKILRLKMRSVS